MTISETKLWLRDELDRLIADKKIKNDAQVARELNITRATLSNMLSTNSKKAPSKNLVTGFRKRYIDPPTTEMPIHALLELNATIKVLFETCVNILSQTTGKSAALISAELKQAINLNKIS